MQYKIVERANPQKREEKLFYPQPIWEKQITEDDLAREISYVSSINAADIRAVIGSLMELLPRHLMNGETVKIERLGIFRLGFDTKGESTEEAVSEKTSCRQKFFLDQM